MVMGIGLRTCLFYIVYLIWFGEAKALATSAGGEVLKAHNILCKFVLIGWAIYPIGYMAELLDGTEVVIYLVST